MLGQPRTTNHRPARGHRECCHEVPWSHIFLSWRCRHADWAAKQVDPPQNMEQHGTRWNNMEQPLAVRWSSSCKWTWAHGCHGSSLSCKLLPPNQDPTPDSSRVKSASLHFFIYLLFIFIFLKCLRFSLKCVSSKDVQRVCSDDVQIACRGDPPWTGPWWHAQRSERRLGSILNAQLMLNQS